VTHCDTKLLQKCQHGIDAVKVDPQRSALMARIRSSDTQPELAVRRMLHAMGLRFRLHRKDLPGRPDLVLARHRLIILVHGCFWHQHVGCRLASDPKSRRQYWAPKLAGNVERDRRNAELLRAAGWCVETIWECEARKPEILAVRLARIASKLTHVRGALPGLGRRTVGGAVDRSRK
jgi:DNA mismatch endonuclease (patch repair protein)